MDTFENSNQPLSEIMPSLTAEPKPAVRPSRFNWRARWAKLRYNRPNFRPQLNLKGFPGGKGSVALLRKYWWAVLVMGLIVLAGGLWWFMDYQQEKSWQQATDYYRRADYKKAAPLLLELPMPDDAEQLRIYGQTMQATDHPDKAIEAYQKLYNKEKDPFAKLVLGNIYNQQRQFDKAIKTYKELIDANPNYIQAYVNLATVYRLQGKNADALDIANRGMRNNANSVVLAELMVSLTMDTPDSTEYKQAVEVLRKINPEDPLLLQIEE